MVEQLNDEREPGQVDEQTPVGEAIVLAKPVQAIIAGILQQRADVMKQFEAKIGETIRVSLAALGHENVGQYAYDYQTGILTLGAFPPTAPQPISMNRAARRTERQK